MGCLNILSNQKNYLSYMEEIMKTEKKIVCLCVLLMAVTIGVFAGGSRDTSSKKLVVYTHQTQQILGDELKDANGNTYRDPNTAWLKILTETVFTPQTGIEVEFVGYSADGSQVKSLLQVGDKGLDIFTTGFTYSNAEYERYTAPIYTKAQAGTIFGNDLAAAMAHPNGNVYNLQIAKEYGEAITYNENVIKAAGYNEIPGDLATFEKMLEAIRAKGTTPISLHRVENWPLGTVEQFSYLVGGEVDTLQKLMNESTPFSENTVVGKTIKLYTTWKSKKYFEQEMYPDFGVAMDSVAYGRAAMMLFGSWVFPQIQSRVPAGTSPAAIKFDAAPDFGKGRFIRVGLAQGYAINKASTKITEAKQFLEFLAKSSDYLVQIGVIPTHKDAKISVPAQFSIIDGRVRSGQVKQLMPAPTSDNTVNSEEVLKDANLYADNLWVGLPFDALDITKPNDWTAYNAQIARQNTAYVNAVKARGVSYK
jgi:ABC-type glycerol-3-phosphate transport system substrate-binding protein